MKHVYIPSEEYQRGWEDGRQGGPVVVTMVLLVVVVVGLVLACLGFSGHLRF